MGPAATEKPAGRGMGGPAGGGGVASGFFGNSLRFWLGHICPEVHDDGK